MGVPITHISACIPSGQVFCYLSWLWCLFWSHLFVIGLPDIVCMCTSSESSWFLMKNVHTLRSCWISASKFRTFPICCVISRQVFECLFSQFYHQTVCLLVFSRYVVVEALGEKRLCYLPITFFVLILSSNLHHVPFISAVCSVKLMIVNIMDCWIFIIITQETIGLFYLSTIDSSYVNILAILKLRRKSDKPNGRHLMEQCLNMGN